MRTTIDVLVATRKQGEPLPAPAHVFNESPAKIAFMVASMKKHMTDEGYQLALALRSGLFHLSGFGFEGNGDVEATVRRYNPSTVVTQDKREWIGRTAGPGFDHRERLQNVSHLRERDNIFKGTVLKDAHSDQSLHVEAATEIGCHFWIIYYHPDIVTAQSPFVRREHLIRTYHSIDPASVNPFQVRNGIGLLSGAISGAYPLRSRLALEIKNGAMKNLEHLKHPGYGRSYCNTPAYLSMLSCYRVAVCTSSRYGYAVRKIIEATAAGCIVVTDLPSDDVLPEIDGNLVRIDSDTSPRQVDELAGDLAAGWNAEKQRMWAERAIRYYDYRALGQKLADDIETLRSKYNG
jgi:hypothetical protein